MSSDQFGDCRKIALRCRKIALNDGTLRVQVGWSLRVTIQPDRGGIMSRQIRSLLALFLVSFALTAAACADASGPNDTTCDTNNPATCK